MNDLDKELSAAQSNLKASQEKRSKIDDLSLSLKEKLALAKAQSKFLTEKNIDLEADHEQADTE